MARMVFPDDRFVYRVAGTALTLAPAATAVFYTDSAGTVLADIRTYDGTTTPGAVLAGSAVAVDAYSRLPLFWGPDGVDALYVRVTGGPVTAVYARTDDRLDALTTREINAGDPRFGTPGTRAAFIAALDAAEAQGQGTVVRIPAGLTIDVLTGLSLSGRSCQIIGAGAGVNGASFSASSISVIKASTQTGPVLNFAGYVTPASFLGRVTPLAQVMIEGSNVADATKANSGIKFTAMSSAYFHDISVRYTGGPCIEAAANPGNGLYLNDFERIVLSAPVSAKLNDVPWFYANECNNNRFRGIGLRSLNVVGDVGVSGAVVIEGNASYPPTGNLFDAWWFENLHPPTNGTIFSLAAILCVVSNLQFVDCAGESNSAIGNSFIRIMPTTVANFGGNSVTGDIPGDNGVTTFIATGVDVRQSYNRIQGTRNYLAKNVTIAAGVDYTYVHLGGSLSGSAGSASAFVNNSTATHNVLVDEINGVEHRGDYTRRSVVGNGGPQFEDATTPTVGNVRLGNAGVRIQVGTNTPEAAVTAPVGSIFLRTNGGAGTTFYVKETGAGNTGWVAK